MSLAAPPVPGAPRPFHFPEVDDRASSGGFGIRTVTRPNAELVSAELVLDAGEGGAKGGQAGIAVLTAAALDGGTELRSGSELAHALEALGSGISAVASWDDLTLSFSAHPSRFEEVVQLVFEVLRRPAFPEGEVARVRDQRLAAIQQRRNSPSGLADDAIMSEVFGEGVPYARPLGGSPGTVEALDSGSLRGHRDRQFRPERGGLAVVGPVTSDEVSAMVERYADGWSGAPETRSAPATRPRHAGGGVLILDRPGSVQSEIRIGGMGIARSSDDFFPLRVFNSVLGGTFTSRLNLNLRERNGFTYGVRSAFRARKGVGPFTISSGVGTDVTAAAVRESVHELRHLLEDGASAEEVAAVRDYLVGVFPLSLEGGGQLAARLGATFTYGLPADYHAEWRDRIAAVDAESATEAGRRSIDPDALRVVVVGAAEEVSGGLAELELGPIRVVAAEDWEAGE